MNDLKPQAAHIIVYETNEPSTIIHYITICNISYGVNNPPQVLTATRKCLLVRKLDGESIFLLLPFVAELLQFEH